MGASHLRTPHDFCPLHSLSFMALDRTAGWIKVMSPRCDSNNVKHLVPLSYYPTHALDHHTKQCQMRTEVMNIVHVAQFYYGRGANIFHILEDVSSGRCIFWKMYLIMYLLESRRCIIKKAWTMKDLQLK